MKYDELIQMILRSDPEASWKRVDELEKSIYVYRDNVNLRIESNHGEEDSHVENFREAWANKFSDPSASSYYVNIYYGASLVHRAILVSVDGGRARLPLPAIGTMRVDQLDYTVAQIFDSIDTLDAYMGRAGLTTI